VRYDEDLKMPAWLEILLAVAGTLNLVGFIVWIIKTLFELKGRLDLIEASLAGIKNTCEVSINRVMAECKFCDADKREMFNTLKRLDRVNVAVATKMGIDLSEFNTGV